MIETSSLVGILNLKNGLKENVRLGMTGLKLLPNTEMVERLFYRKSFRTCTQNHERFKKYSQFRYQPYLFESGIVIQEVAKKKFKLIMSKEHLGKLSKVKFLPVYSTYLLVKEVEES